MTDFSPTGLQWNVQSALANLDNSVSDLKELLQIWFRQTPRLLSEIRIALGNNEISKARQAAHTLKGSLQILGADDSAAFELEWSEMTCQSSHFLALLTRLENQIGSIDRQAIEFMNKN